MDIIFLHLDPLSETTYPERERPKTPAEEKVIHFLELFKSKEQLFWVMEIIGCAFELVGEDVYKTTYERALEIYKTILIVVSHSKNHGQKSSIELKAQLYPMEICFEEVGTD